MVTSPTASRLPTFNSRASAIRSAWRGLAQEIDVEIGGDRQRLRPDRRKHRDIHGEIGQLHHGRAGNRAAGAQVILMNACAPARRHSRRARSTARSRERTPAGIPTAAARRSPRPSAPLRAGIVISPAGRPIRRLRHIRRTRRRQSAIERAYFGRSLRRPASIGLSIRRP